MEGSSHVSGPGKGGLCRDFRCGAQRLGQDFSSFLVLGRGGVEASPDEPQASSPGAPGKRAGEATGDGTAVP